MKSIFNTVLNIIIISMYIGVMIGLLFNIVDKLDKIIAILSHAK